ncbi:MAG: hypothetical protein ABIQ84_07615 [Usitatibacter sp.]
MIQEVSGAANRQSKEIDQLARAIDELDHLTQNNTRMVGSWTDRAGRLREELQRLAGLVSRFRLPHQPGTAVSAPPAPVTEVTAVTAVTGKRVPRPSTVA